jgi:Transglycosylase SLT domain
VSCYLTLHWRSRLPGYKEEASTSKERRIWPETFTAISKGPGDRPAKPIQPTKNPLMRKTVLIMSAVLLLGVSCDKSHMQQAKTGAMTGDQELDKEVRRVMEKGINLEERKAQVPAIAAAFSLRTDAKRARWLAALCYVKTLGTPFMPMDLAEIALAETGGHGLSSAAVSKRGAVGVWQLMPRRAMSHGYSPEDMVNDEKCAEAAVKELEDKLIMARGNLVKAKKFYCGVGPEANAYEAKRRIFRRVILDFLSGNNTPESEAVRLKVAQAE